MKKIRAENTWGNLRKWWPSITVSDETTTFWDDYYTLIAQSLVTDDIFLDAITPMIVERARAKKEGK